MKKIKMLLVVMLLFSVGILSGCINEKEDSVGSTTVENEEKDNTIYFFCNITVVDAGQEKGEITGANNKKLDTFTRTYIESNTTKYYLDYQNVTTLIGKKLFIKYHYPSVKFYFDSFRKLEEGIEPIELDVHIDNFTILEDSIVDVSYAEFKKYIKNCCHELQININAPDVVLPVLDRYGRNIHYKTSFIVEISNPCNVSTHLKTNISDFNIYDPRMEVIIPSDLNNNYFVINYPDVIVLDAFETKEYLFSIEVFGSGAEQIFFPKEYMIRFFFSNGFTRSNFAINVIFDDFDGGQG